MTILITGHTGFVGQALVKVFSGYSLHLVGRRPLSESHGVFFQKQFNESENFFDSLCGVSVVIHAAASIHISSYDSKDPLATFRVVNVAGTLNLAKQAASVGVKRFIFISSVKVNGESTKEGKPFLAYDKAQPQDPYSISKAEAEDGLRELCTKTGMEFVIIRPPLVYGPGVKANFAAMLCLAQKNLPLPFGAIRNSRSMVSVGNLVDLIKICASHPNAANQIFLVSDDCDVSTTELLKLMIHAYGKLPRLIPLPMSLLRLLGILIGKRVVISKLCGNLQVDISATKKQLNWQPPFSVEQGIQSCISKEDLC